jgi:hypothetical protein
LSCSSRCSCEKLFFRVKIDNSINIICADARIYNVWKLSVSCNGWHLAKIKVEKHLKKYLK